MATKSVVQDDKVGINVTSALSYRNQAAINIHQFLISVYALESLAVLLDGTSLAGRRRTKTSMRYAIGIFTHYEALTLDKTERFISTMSCS